MNDTSAKISHEFESMAVLELESLHPGLPVLDAMVKQAPVNVLTATPMDSGRFLIVVVGKVGEVESSYRRGLEVSGPPFDHLFLAEAHPDVLPALSARTLGAAAGESFSPRSEATGAIGPNGKTDRSLGLFETRSVCSGLHAADRVLKEAEVALVSLHLARGIVGKTFGAVLGRQDMVEAALDIAANAAHVHQRWEGSALLAQPDEAVLRQWLDSPWGFLGGQEIL